MIVLSWTDESTIIFLRIYKQEKLTQSYYLSLRYDDLSQSEVYRHKDTTNRRQMQVIEI